MTDVALTAATRHRLNALFDETDRPQVERLLVEQCGTGLPFCRTADAAVLERIRVAVLKLSNGQLAQLRAAIDLAKVDWRDLLVAAGFGSDAHAHEAWFPKSVTSSQRDSAAERRTRRSPWLEADS